jgi:hypothetical protein
VYDVSKTVYYWFLKPFRIYVAFFADLTLYVHQMSYCICSTRSTPWCRVFLWKLTVPQPVKKFPTFYRIHRFITMFTSTHHLALSCAWSIHSTSPPQFYFLKINFNIILPFTLMSSQWSVSFRFPYYNPVCTSLFIKSYHNTKPSIITTVKS